MKRVNATLTKKDGTLTVMHQEAFDSIIRSSGKVYPRQWVGSRKHKSLRTIESYVMDFAKAYGFKVKTGNDAPRGGQEGFYIQFTSRAVKSLASKH